MMLVKLLLCLLCLSVFGHGDHGNWGTCWGLLENRCHTQPDHCEIDEIVGFQHGQGYVKHKVCRHKGHKCFGEETTIDGHRMMDVVKHTKGSTPQTNVDCFTTDKDNRICVTHGHYFCTIKEGQEVAVYRRDVDENLVLCNGEKIIAIERDLTMNTWRAAEANPRMQQMVNMMGFGEDDFQCKDTLSSWGETMIWDRMALHWAKTAGEDFDMKLANVGRKLCHDIQKCWSYECGVETLSSTELWAIMDDSEKEEVSVVLHKVAPLTRVEIGLIIGGACLFVVIVLIVFWKACCKSYKKLDDTHEPDMEV